MTDEHTITKQIMLKFKPEYYQEIEKTLYDKFGPSGDLTTYCHYLIRQDMKGE